MDSGGTWRLGHRPALDGVRGVAVLLVVVHHTGLLGNQAAGVVGVTMFFTLSGFLITALLLEEHEATGRISLSRFFKRRARRLLPAVTAMLVLVSAFLFSIGYSLRTLLSDVVPVVFYYGNWQRATGDYLGLWSHTWSLAVEEQFYLCWPLLLVFFGRRVIRAVFLLAAAGVAYAVVARMLLWDGGAGADRVYYGSDMHVDALLMGAALATWMHLRREGSGSGRVAAVALAALVGLGLAVQSEIGTFVGAVTLAPVLTCVVLWASSQAVVVPWLQGRALVAVGRRSYGLYLWHYPIFALFSEVLPWSTWVTVPLLLAASWGLTVLSWRYVEQPFLRRSRHTEEVPSELGARDVQVSA